MNVKRVILTLTDDIVDSIDGVISKGRYVSRSEVVREALRKFLESE